jgi:hypothetical protein
MKFAMLTLPCADRITVVMEGDSGDARHRPEIVTGVSEYFAAGKNVPECRESVELRDKAIIFSC